MAGKEILLETHKPLQLHTPNSQGGVEKVVYQMTDGTNIYAAKIFRDELRISGTKIDKTSRSKEELLDYQRLTNSPLALYIPKPYMLLKDENNGIIGLAVEWREGISLEKIKADGNKLLSPQDLDELENAMIQTVRGGIILRTDMYTKQNIMFDVTSHPRLWFAECGIEDVPRRNRNTEYYITSTIDSYRQEFI